MSRERPGSERLRDQALSCSTEKAPTAATATAISTRRLSHSLPLGVGAAAAVANQTHPLCMFTITIQHDHVRGRCRDRQ